jgi:hypothetical protein
MARVIISIIWIQLTENMIIIDTNRMPFSIVSVNSFNHIPVFKASKISIQGFWTSENNSVITVYIGAQLSQIFFFFLQIYHYKRQHCYTYIGAQLSQNVFFLSSNAAFCSDISKERKKSLDFCSLPVYHFIYSNSCM